MDYNTPTYNTPSKGQAIASLFVASIMFILGYTVIRVSMAEADGSVAASVAAQDGTDIQMVVPGEGTLWADFGPSR
ncbi:MAG: hypothetical protein WBA76_07860 [Phormidesmis sp.]